MRARASFIAVLGLTVAVVGCGDNGTTATTGTTTTTSVTTTTVSTAQLDAMLLEVGDVGVGWQVGSDVNEADFSDSTKIPCADVTMNPTVAQRLTPVTGIQFEPADGSYKHMIEFVVTGDPQQLDSDLEAFFGAIESCSTVTSTTAGGGTLTVEKLTIPELGDQRAAFTYTGTEAPDSTMTWFGRSATVRVGPIAVELGLTEILSTPQERPQISDEEFVKLVQTAVAKVDV